MDAWGLYCISNLFGFQPVNAVEPDFVLPIAGIQDGDRVAVADADDSPGLRRNA
jgi:hypothetical protein